MNSSQDLATLALRRWAELRAQGVPPKDRLADSELQQYERQIEAVRKEMRDA